MSLKCNMAQYPPLGGRTHCSWAFNVTTQEDGAPFSWDTWAFLTITPVSGLANTAVTGDTNLAITMGNRPSEVQLGGTLVRPRTLRMYFNQYQIPHLEFRLSSPHAIPFSHSSTSPSQTSQGRFPVATAISTSRRLGPGTNGSAVCTSICLTSLTICTFSNWEE
jgi:hypothetical protein